MKKKSSRDKLITLLSERYNRSEKQTKKLLSEIEEGIKDILIENDSVRIKGVGTLRLKIVKESKRRNPKTGEEVKVPKKYKLGVTTYKSFQEILNNKFNQERGK